MSATGLVGNWRNPRGVTLRVAKGAGRYWITWDASVPVEATASWLAQIIQLGEFKREVVNG